VVIALLFSLLQSISSSCFSYDPALKTAVVAVDRTSASSNCMHFGADSSVMTLPYFLQFWYNVYPLSSFTRMSLMQPPWSVINASKWWKYSLVPQSDNTGCYTGGERLRKLGRWTYLVSICCDCGHNGARPGVEVLSSVRTVTVSSGSSYFCFTFFFHFVLFPFTTTVVGDEDFQTDRRTVTCDMWRVL